MGVNVLRRKLRCDTKSTDPTWPSSAWRSTALC